MTIPNCPPLQYIAVRQAVFDGFPDGLPDLTPLGVKLSLEVNIAIIIPIIKRAFTGVRHPSERSSS